MPHEAIGTLDYAGLSADFVGAHQLSGNELMGHDLQRKGEWMENVFLSTYVANRKNHATFFKYS